MKFACISFYTVNLTKSDPYRMDISLFEGEAVKETKTYRFNVGDALIDPIYINIPESELRSGISFSDQWEKIKGLLNEYKSVCCFRSGDHFNALYQTLKKNSLSFPDIILFDAQNMARRSFPDRVEYSYTGICRDLNIQIENSSYIDTCSIAKLVIRFLEETNCPSIDYFFEKYGYIPGRMSSDGAYIKSFLKRKRDVLSIKDPKAEKLSPEEGTSVDPNNFFFGKNVLFTGSFKEWGFETKTECQQLIVNIGGYAQSGLNSHTNVLVEGIQVSTKKENGSFTMSGKQKQARAKKEKGQDIEIISGDDFYSYVFEYL